MDVDRGPHRRTDGLGTRPRLPGHEHRRRRRHHARRPRRPHRPDRCCPRRSPIDLDMRHQLGSLLGDLDDRSASIVRLRYGLDDGRPWGLAEIGTKLNLSRERVRQLERAAVRKLRESASPDLLSRSVTIDPNGDTESTVRPAAATTARKKTTAHAADPDRRDAPDPVSGASSSVRQDDRVQTRPRLLRRLRRCLRPDTGSGWATRWVRRSPTAVSTPASGRGTWCCGCTDHTYVEIVTTLDHPAADRMPFGQAVKAVRRRAVAGSVGSSGSTSCTVRGAARPSSRRGTPDHCPAASDLAGASSACSTRCATRSCRSSSPGTEESAHPCTPPRPPSRIGRPGDLRQPGTPSTTGWATRSTDPLGRVAINFVEADEPGLVAVHFVTPHGSSGSTDPATTADRVSRAGSRCSVLPGRRSHPRGTTRRCWASSSSGNVRSSTHASIVLELRHRAGADQHRRDPLVPQHPCERQLGERLPAVGGESVELADQPE